MIIFNLKCSFLVTSLVCWCVFVILRTDAVRSQIKVTVLEDSYIYENTAIPASYKMSKQITSQDCFNLCKMDSNCGSISFESHGICYLNIRNMRARALNGMITISKQVLEPILPYYYKYWNVRLSGHYRFESNVNYENHCFDICLTESKCNAITYDAINKICYFCERDKFESNYDKMFISMSRQVISLINENATTFEPPFFYENMRLFKHYKGMPVDSAESCFNECKNENEKCTATLLGPDNYCYLFHKGDFDIWDNERNWRVMSKEPFTLEPNKYLYEGLRLYNQYSYLEKSNEQCAQHCESQSDCYAVAYRPDTNMGCFLYNSDQYRAKKVKVDAKKWEIKSKDVIQLEEKMYEPPLVEPEIKVNGSKSRSFNYPNIRLTNHYANYTDFQTSADCFQNCTLDDDCFAVGFNRKEILCNLYRAEEFDIEKSNKWVVFSKDILEIGLKSNFFN